MLGDSQHALRPSIEITPNSKHSIQTTQHSNQWWAQFLLLQGHPSKSYKTAGTQGRAPLPFPVERPHCFPAFMSACLAAMPPGHTSHKYTASALCSLTITAPT
eukprot:1142152-Pelagomonas_calceolata.AAC.7